jgi:hypothetical protein
VAQRGRDELAGELLAVGGEVLEGDAVGPEVVLQPGGVGQVAEAAVEEEAVEAGEDAQDDGGEAAYTSDPGVPRGGVAGCCEPPR